MSKVFVSKTKTTQWVPQKNEHLKVKCYDYSKRVNWEYGRAEDLLQRIWEHAAGRSAFGTRGGYECEFCGTTHVEEWIEDWWQCPMPELADFMTGDPTIVLRNVYEADEHRHGQPIGKGNLVSKRSYERLIKRQRESMRRARSNA
jgi:hypothetical protein